jgi:hypothetical protein
LCPRRRQPRRHHLHLPHSAGYLGGACGRAGAHDHGGASHDGRHRQHGEQRLVSITTTDVDVQPANNTLTQNTTINDGADLTAVMSGAPNPATGGGLVTWTISGGNLGPNTSGPVTFTTTLPGC